MYKSPIEVIYGQVQTDMQTQLEKCHFQVVQEYGINVDKQELIKALAYDRNQYEAGFKDASANIVRCEECRHGKRIPLGPQRGLYECRLSKGYLWSKNDFCSYGERKVVENGEVQAETL